MKDYEKNIVLFVYRCKIVLSTNIRYLLGNKKYYQVVVKRLVDKGYLRRYKTKYLMLVQVCKKYIKELGYIYSKPSYKKEYVKKMTTISLLASLFIGNGIEFTPSFELKDFAIPLFMIFKKNKNINKLFYLLKI